MGLERNEVYRCAAIAELHETYLTGFYEINVRVRLARIARNISFRRAHRIVRPNDLAQQICCVEQALPQLF